MTPITVSQLYIYPVKSLAGISVNTWPVDCRGFRYDRKWMLVDQNKRFLSQRQLPEMALVKTRISNHELILSTSPENQISLPLQTDAGDSLEVSIWNDRCVAQTISHEVDQWFSDFLHTDCQLVYKTDDYIRPVDPVYARTSDQVAFSDGFPFLLISENSLQSLNQAMQLNLPVVRFRPNLVISGCGEYAEDYWRKITINGINFRLPKPCSRCSIPTINPATAKTGKEPLTTLNRLRKWNNQVYFGQNALHDCSGELSVGDIVHIKQTGPRQPSL